MSQRRWFHRYTPLLLHAHDVSVLRNLLKSTVFRCDMPTTCHLILPSLPVEDSLGTREDSGGTTPTLRNRQVGPPLCFANSYCSFCITGLSKRKNGTKFFVTRKCSICKGFMFMILSPSRRVDGCIVLKHGLALPVRNVDLASGGETCTSYLHSTSCKRRNSRTAFP